MLTLFECNIDIETKRQKTETQKDNKTKDDQLDSEDIQTTSNDLLRLKTRDGEGGGRCHQDFLIYDLKRSVDLR